jgi:hypothetical protein
MEEYEEALRKLNEAKKECVRIGRIAFAQGLTALFSTYPIMKSFKWSQYTPYFCDGDTCLFGVYADDVTINDNEDDFGYGPQSYPEISEAIGKFIYSFDNDHLLEFFGDHVEVIVSREADGIQVKVEYIDHD